MIDPSSILTLSLQLAAGLANVIANAISAGDVETVESLTKVLPTADQIAARDAALKVRQQLLAEKHFGGEPPK